MNWKKIGHALMHVQPALLALMCALCTVLLTYALIALPPASPLAIAAYALSFVTLVLLCLRVPDMVRFVQRLRAENRFWLRYRQDVRLRMNLSLWASVCFNAAYALFQLGLGLWHHSAFFYAMAGYYVTLGGLRLMLARAVRGRGPEDDLPAQWRRYRLCGVWLLLMTLTLTVFSLYFVYQIRDFRHHEITTIAMAAYTFTALTVAIVGAVRYQRYRSPAYSAAKALSLTSATVSLLTLENALFTAFGQDTSPLLRRVMLAATSAAVMLFVIALAIHMIRRATRALHQ